jgi:hypothetical protein
MLSRERDRRADRSIAHCTRVRCTNGVPPTEVNEQIRTVAEREIAGIPSLWQTFLAGQFPVV